MIFWKGKGIMIILYFIVTGFVFAIVNRLIIEHIGDAKLPIEVFMGIVLIATGAWTKLTAEDYYIDKEGRKQSLGIENELYFISMATWGIILPCLGLGLVIWGILS